MKDNRQPINYTFADISRYLNGNMTAAEMHDIERAALHDPFLYDAIEGYREADIKKASAHITEIASLLQKTEAQAEVIVMPKRRNYTWQIAASIIAIIGLSLFLLYKPKNISQVTSLAQNKTIVKQKEDSISYENKLPNTSSLQDSLLANATTLSYSQKRKTIVSKSYKQVEKDEAEQPDLVASTAAASPRDERTKTLSFEKNDSADRDKALAMKEAPLPAIMDTQNAEVVVTKPLSRNARAQFNNTWTTDKGKPFILSDVEEIKLGKKRKTATDTSAVKPEGGWQSFQEYLFSKLSKKDTANFINAARFDGSLELEFSLTENGSPYNIKVLQAPDSTMAKTAAEAVEQGPKWITAGKKQKRLNIKY